MDESILLQGKKWSLPLLLSFEHSIDDSLMILGRKWAMPVVLEILSGRNRFNSILGSLPGINGRTLSARLRDLRASGLIERTKTDSNPSQVHYVLTPKGEEMRQLVLDIVSFSLKWHENTTSLAKPDRLNGRKNEAFHSVY